MSTHASWTRRRKILWYFLLRSDVMGNNWGMSTSDGSIESLMIRSSARNASNRASLGTDSNRNEMFWSAITKSVACLA